MNSLDNERRAVVLAERITDAVPSGAPFGLAASAMIFSLSDQLLRQPGRPGEKLDAADLIASMLVSSVSRMLGGLYPPETHRRETTMPVSE